MTPTEQARAHIDRCCYARGYPAKGPTRDALARLVTARLADGLTFDPAAADWELAARDAGPSVYRLAWRVAVTTRSLAERSLL